MRLVSCDNWISIQLYTWYSWCYEWYAHNSNKVIYSFSFHAISFCIESVHFISAPTLVTTTKSTALGQIVYLNSKKNTLISSDKLNPVIFFSNLSNIINRQINNKNVYWIMIDTLTPFLLYLFMTMFRLYEWIALIIWVTKKFVYFSKHKYSLMNMNLTGTPRWNLFGFLFFCTDKN